MVKNNDFNRRKFIKNTAAVAAAFTIIPRSVMGKGFVAPSDRLNIAVIGGGGKGYSDAVNAYNKGASNIAAICDVDWHRSAKLFKEFPKAKKYKDFRLLLDEMKDIDALTISTPDHTHAVVANAAMQLGKHVYVQKPLTHNIYEARVLTESARKNKIVTQMGNQGASGPGVKQMQQWFDEGKIGKVDKVEVWTNRPIWPQGMAAPTDKPKLLDGLDWDSWIGPAEWVDYHPSYHPFKWRGWWNFGTGALGDMGCHLMDPPFRVLGLKYPTEVESSVGAIFTRDWTPDYYPESCPPSSRTELKFEATDKNPKTLKMTWIDGGLRPFHPDLIPADHAMGDEDSSNGAIMYGEKGIMVCGTYGRNPKIYHNNGDIEVAPKNNNGSNLPENGHQADWVNACKAGYGSKEHKALTSSFDYAGPLTESVLMGNLAIRSYNLRDNKSFPGRKRLLWDGKNMTIKNFDTANQFVRRKYRKGWTL